MADCSHVTTQPVLLREDFALGLLLAHKTWQYCNLIGLETRSCYNTQQIFNRTMKDTLEASTKAQEKQTEALEKLNISTKQKDHDHMFAALQPYDGKDSK